MTHDEKPAQGRLIYPLENILDRLDFVRMFPVSQPVELELGSGDGSFLVQYASMHRDINFLGVERLLGRLRKIERKGLRAGLDNLLAVRIECSYLVQYLIAPSSLRAIHVYFPDPWPKRKHWHKRLVNETFPAQARKALAKGGTVFLRTDDSAYFEQMRQVFSAEPHFQKVETPEELSGVVTDFERDFNARGISTLRAAYQKSS